MNHQRALQWIVDLQRDEDMLSPYQRELLRREAAQARLALYRLRHADLGGSE